MCKTFITTSHYLLKFVEILFLFFHVILKIKQVFVDRDVTELSRAKYYAGSVRLGFKGVGSSLFISLFTS